MYPFAVVVHILVVFAFPNAPAFGRNLRDALIAAEELEEVGEVLQALGTIPAGATFVFHGIVVILSFLEDRSCELSFFAESRNGGRDQFCVSCNEVNGILLVSLLELVIGQEYLVGIDVEFYCFGEGLFGLDDEGTDLFL
jgi:hypothetical protein